MRLPAGFKRADLQEFAWSGAAGERANLPVTALPFAGLEARQYMTTFPKQIRFKNANGRWAKAKVIGVKVIGDMVWWRTDSNLLVRSDLCQRTK